MEEQPPPPVPSEADTTKAETASRTRSRAETWASRGRCSSVSSSTSHTRYHKRRQYEADHKLVTRDEFYSESETISGSCDTCHCVHGPAGKIYTEKGLLKRNLMKELDPIPFDPKWTEECEPAYGWDIASKLEFLVTDPTVELQRERLENHVQDFAKISANGYRVDSLASLCVTLEYLVTAMESAPSLRASLDCLLRNLEKPILFCKGSDAVTYFDTIRHFIGYLGYLLARLQDEAQFDIVSRAVLYQLSAGDDQRGTGVARRALLLAAAAPPLLQTVVRMIAFSSSRRFPTFLRIALLLACDCTDNCIEMVQENILENIFYRFNPYFPDKCLPYHEISPFDCQDHLVRLGDSSVHMSMTLSLLLVLLSTTLRIVQEERARARLLPCPDCYALRCFVWAYRYECRARGRSHQRATLTVVIAVLLRCFSERLLVFSYMLMPDLLSLSVATEVPPPRRDWTGSVQFSTSQQDVLFKKLLIYVCVDCIKAFPYNRFMMESRLWLLGLSYLLDPGLCHLRARWSPPLFAEIRKVALQALVLTLPLCDPQVIIDYGIIRRILWYIEWYTERPYEIQVLYWCVRVLHVAMHARPGPARQQSLRTLFNTHGIIILVQLCRTLLRAPLPLVESAQCVVSVCLRVLASGSARDERVSCVVYPQLRWPAAAHALAVFSLDVALLSLRKSYILNNRWLVALLNFIWEAVVWKPEYRKQFVADNGIYKLLDLITMCSGGVQCLALATVCDCARAAGAGVAHLVTWRAPQEASHVNPMVVKRGATIASLLAAVFRDECHREGVRLNHLGVLQDLECPIMSADVRSRVSDPRFDVTVNPDTPLSYVAADIAGSLKSKAFALLHLLSDDLEHKVALADEAYNLYRNVKLSVEEETVLVLCSHYLTLKVGEVWAETSAWGQGYVPHDQAIFDDFLQVTNGWSKEIKRQQEEVIARSERREGEEESTLYSFLGRVRLNFALDALREVTCVVRTSDRAALSQALLQDAVRALRMRRTVQKPLLRTYVPPLDVQNVTGQNVKVQSILPKDKPQPRDEYLSPST